MAKELRTYNGEKIVSSINSVGKTGQPTCERTKLAHYHIQK